MAKSLPDIIDYPLPLQKSVIAKMKAARSPLADYVSGDADDVVAQIRAEWSQIKTPVLKRLAEAIIAVPLECVTGWGKRYWLTFRHDDYWSPDSESDVTLSIVGPNLTLTKALRNEFPLDNAPGLEEFLTRFGGLRDRNVEHSGNFFDPLDWFLFRKNDKTYDWGRIDDWEGALPLYCGGSGDYVLIKRDGTVGSWSHGIGWGEKQRLACKPLKYTFKTLMAKFVDCIPLATDSEEKMKSPFYL